MQPHRTPLQHKQHTTSAKIITKTKQINGLIYISHAQLFGYQRVAEPAWNSITYVVCKRVGLVGTQPQLQPHHQATCWKIYVQPHENAKETQYGKLEIDMSTEQNQNSQISRKLSHRNHRKPNPMCTHIQSLSLSILPNHTILCNRRNSENETASKPTATHALSPQAGIDRVTNQHPSRSNQIHRKYFRLLRFRFTACKANIALHTNS